MAHKFNPSEMNKLDNPERKKLLPPLETLQKLGLEKGHDFLEVGAGTGFFALPASNWIGESGMAYAFDTSVEMVDELKKRSGEQGRSNLRVESCEEAGPVRLEKLVDFVLVAFVLHEVLNPQAFLINLRSCLKPGGRLAIIEWKKVVTEKGPPIHERLSEDEVCQLLKAADLDNVEVSPLNGSHYGIVARLL